MISKRPSNAQTDVEAAAIHLLHLPDDALHVSSGLSRDNGRGKAATVGPAAMPPGGEHAEESKARDVLQSSSSSNSIQATNVGVGHSNPAIVGEAEPEPVEILVREFDGAAASAAAAQLLHYLSMASKPNKPARRPSVSINGPKPATQTPPISVSRPTPATLSHAKSSDPRPRSAEQPSNSIVPGLVGRYAPTSMNSRSSTRANGPITASSSSKQVKVGPYPFPKVHPPVPLNTASLSSKGVKVVPNVVPKVNPTVLPNTTSSSSKGAKARNKAPSSSKRVKVEPNLVPKANPTVPQKDHTGPKIGTISCIGSARAGDRRRQRQCDICTEKRQTYEMTRINNTCSHTFCTTCVSKHIKTRVADNQVAVPCPGLDCKHEVEYQACIGFLSCDVLDVWDRALCESLILDAYKFYCPYRDCSAMLVNDLEKVIQQCECPHCHRLFCAQCRVPWHADIACSEFLALNEDERGKEDLLVRKLASEKKWGRCPQCKFFVERTGGCPHMVCRCKFEFCYGCGKPWSDTHGGCAGT